MLPMITAVSGSFCALCACCRDWTVFDISAGMCEGSGGLQLHFSCDLLHGAVVLLADCLPSVAC